MKMWKVTYQIGSFTRELYVDQADAATKDEAIDLAKRMDLIPNAARNFNATRVTL